MSCFVVVVRFGAKNERGESGMGRSGIALCDVETRYSEAVEDYGWVPVAPLVARDVKCHQERFVAPPDLRQHQRIPSPGDLNIMGRDDSLPRDQKMSLLRLLLLPSYDNPEKNNDETVN